jgi:organic radical activating enzyme
MINQEESKFDDYGGQKLPLVEQFYTIQGEGYHMGKPAYFIRIGGCDIGCHWCDSKLTWDPAVHPLVDIEDIKRSVAGTPAKSIVVTGGEPSLYNLDPLCKTLKPLGVKTFLETSGTGDLTGRWDWVCLSPKKQSPPEKVFYNKADELKVIIFDEGDIIWAEEAAKLVNSECRLYLQPEWSRYETIIPAVVEFVKKNPQWNVSLQAHKFMHIP